jgi:polyphosphate glucokinase
MPDLSPQRQPERILVVDVGGSSVKILAAGQTEPRRSKSGHELTPPKLVEVVGSLAEGWTYDAVSIGYPGLVRDNRPCSEPGNLGPGWVGFDFACAFGRPVRVINDASMQALGSYDGGRMLFLGMGTGLGSALIVENVLVSLELGNLPYRGRKLSEVLAREGLERMGRKAWRRKVYRLAPALMAALAADYVVLGGGNAKELDADDLPPGIRIGHNLTAFRGGLRLWRVDAATSVEKPDGVPPSAADWRLL